MADDGTWSFRADICTLDVIHLFDGELFDLLAAHFQTLIGLKHFHEGCFHLDVPLLPSTLLNASFSAEVIGMCSALEISMDIHFHGST